MIDFVVSTIFGAMVGATVAVWSMYSYGILHKPKASDEEAETTK